VRMLGVFLFVALCVLFFSPELVLAAGGGAHGPEGTPWRQLIIPQIFNFGLMVLLLIYFLKTPIRQHFATRKESFESERTKAANALIEAETKRKEISGRLSSLGSSFDKEIQGAKQQAIELKNKAILDAKQLAEKILSETDRVAQFEHQKAIASLRTELVMHAVKEANVQLAAGLPDVQKTQLSAASVKKMRAVI
jgi:F0F1-type ATP synthase membrane subunit b/b'